MSNEENLTWNEDTPGRVPAGARISAGKSGNVARSLPTIALVLENWFPVSCIPSPESPAKRITTSSTVSCLVAGALFEVIDWAPIWRQDLGVAGSLPEAE